MRPATTLLLVFLTSTIFWGQSGTSAISGTVNDLTGSPIPNARITVINRDTGVQQESVTNESGLYRVVALLPGTYQVGVEADGFDKISRGPVLLQVSQTVAIDVTLQVGRQSEAVQVTEAAPLIESQSSNVAQVVNRAMLNGLPLPNRAASSLAALAPGVVMIDTGAGTAENYPIFSVAGGSGAHPD